MGVLKRMLPSIPLLSLILLFFYSPASSYEQEAQPFSSEPAVSFAVVSDIHVQSWDTVSQQKWENALDDLNQVNPTLDALIINGDLGDGRESDYETIKRILAKHSHPPVYTTIGNHEYYQAWYDKNGKWSPNTFPNHETEEASKERYLHFRESIQPATDTSEVYNDVWINDYHFIFLGSEHYRQTDDHYEEDAFLSDTQLNWLSEKLSENYVPGKPIFVFLHQPLPNTVAGSGIEGNNHGVIQEEELRKILSKYPEVIFFSGHTHWELSSPQTIVRDGFTMINSSSVREPWNAYNEPIKVAKSEGLYVEVYTDRVIVRGRDFVHNEWIPAAEFIIWNQQGQ